MSKPYRYSETEGTSGAGPGRTPAGGRPFAWARPAAAPRDALYVRVPWKFALVLALSIGWMALSVVLSQPWLDDLSAHVGRAPAIVMIVFIAYVPGFMNAFLIGAIAFDRRPVRRPPRAYPPLCVLVAAYREEDNLDDTLASLAAQDYPGPLTVVDHDDGSDDRTFDIATAFAAGVERSGLTMRVIRQPRNGGKAAALNLGFAATTEPLVVTVDADSWLRADALSKIVQRFLSDPRGTVAVAGAVLVRNSRDGWLARAQEWDYFHGIAAVKRMQSLFHGTLVAQGAFSLYTRAALREVGGWPDCVGEDIVMSWALLKTGARIGYCEDAIAFTDVPTRVGQFSAQRQRWSRGLMEAFARHASLLFKPRLSTLFVWWNLLFVPLDVVYTFVFVPGVVAALFGIYWIAGPWTLLVLPLALLWNAVIFRVQSRMFREQGLRVRRNIAGFLIYTFGYTMLLQPVCVAGYVSELLRREKTWGTK